MTTEPLPGPINTEITLNGEIYDLTDPDDAIDAYDHVKALLANVYYDQAVIKGALLKIAGEAPVVPLLSEVKCAERATRRVVGERRTAKLTMPNTTFDQAVLREMWNKHPAIAARYLKIQSLSVRRRELGKMKVAGGEPDTMEFLEVMRDAEKQPTSLPTVTVEH